MFGKVLFVLLDLSFWVFNALFVQETMGDLGYGLQGNINA